MISPWVAVTYATDWKGREVVGTGCPAEAKTRARKDGDFLNPDSCQCQRGLSHAAPVRISGILTGPCKINSNALTNR